MLARSFLSTVGMLKSSTPEIDLSSRETAGRITPLDFHRMTLPQRTELHDRYPEIYRLLVTAEKGHLYEERTL